MIIWTIHMGVYYPLSVCFLLLKLMVRPMMKLPSLISNIRFSSRGDHSIPPPWPLLDQWPIWMQSNAHYTYLFSFYLIFSDVTDVCSPSSLNHCTITSEAPGSSHSGSFGQPVNSTFLLFAYFVTKSIQCLLRFITFLASLVYLFLASTWVYIWIAVDVFKVLA